MSERKRKRVIYCPPPRQVIDEYARRVCERLAERTGSKAYVEMEVILGFSRFLQLSADIWAKHLTKQYEEAGKKLDSDEK